MLGHEAAEWECPRDCAIRFRFLMYDNDCEKLCLCALDIAEHADEQGLMSIRFQLKPRMLPDQPSVKRQAVTRV